jgi:hypothetical protein
LSCGEIEGYFGMTENSKGRYIEVSRQIKNHEKDVPSEISMLLEWANCEDNN